MKYNLLFLACLLTLSMSFNAPRNHKINQFDQKHFGNLKQQSHNVFVIKAPISNDQFLQTQFSKPFKPTHIVTITTNPPKNQRLQLNIDKSQTTVKGAQPQTDGYYPWGNNVNLNLNEILNQPQQFVKSSGVPQIQHNQQNLPQVNNLSNQESVGTPIPFLAPSSNEPIILDTPQVLPIFPSQNQPLAETPKQTVFQLTPQYPINQETASLPNDQPIIPSNQILPPIISQSTIESQTIPLPILTNNTPAPVLNGGYLFSEQNDHDTLVSTEPLNINQGNPTSEIKNDNTIIPEQNKPQIKPFQVEPVIALETHNQIPQTIVQSNIIENVDNSQIQSSPAVTTEPIELNPILLENHQEVKSTQTPLISESSSLNLPNLGNSSFDWHSYDFSNFDANVVNPILGISAPLLGGEQGQISIGENASEVISHSDLSQGNQ